MEHTLDIKIYYEDTDCLGIVYHSNYLKYMERGRTEYFGTYGRPIWEWNKDGFNFAVFEVKIKFLKPARLGDVCQVITRIDEDGGSDYRMKMLQTITFNGEKITDAEVDIICLNNDGKLITIPKEVM